MTEFRWISESAIRAIQAELIAEYGGRPGILNGGQLISTLARPQNLVAYGDKPNLFELAAAYGYGFIKNHCFVDGNKRVAVAAIDVFLQLNGYQLTAEESSVVTKMLDVAGSMKPAEEVQHELALWIEANASAL